MFYVTQKQKRWRENFNLLNQRIKYFIVKLFYIIEFDPCYFRLLSIEDL